jgi:tetratricopeptide (TPR) repeat protein
MDAARLAITAGPSRPEGHFWLAANMGALSESFGARLKYFGPIKDSFERVIKIEPGFMEGGAYRGLARWAFNELLFLSGRNKAKSEDYLKRALAYNPDNIASLFTLAELYIKMKRYADAREQLEKALAAPVRAESAPEDQELKRSARALLRELSIDSGGARQ